MLQTFSRYKRELEIVKIKTVCNITYAEACRKQRSTANQLVPDRSSSDEFPPLPVGYGNGVLSQTTQPSNCSRTTSTIDPQLECSTQAENSSGFTFGNPLLFFAFLAEVINKALDLKENNKPTDIFEIISKAAGGKIGLQLSTSDLKALALQWSFKSYSGIADPFMENIQSLNTICHNLHLFQICFVYRKLILVVSISLNFHVTQYYARIGPRTSERAGDFAFVSNTPSLTHKLPYPLSTGWKLWVLKSTTSTFLMYTIPQTITLIRQFWIKWSGTRKVIICGDFNSHHGMWGSLSMDANGRTLVSFTESND